MTAVQSLGLPAKPAPAVEVLDLWISFGSNLGETHVVRGVSFSLCRGERLAIVGESGSGKSMTALAMMGLVPTPGRISGGDIHINGRSTIDLDSSAWRRLRGREVAMVFQDPMTALNPVQSIGKQLVEAIRLHHPISAAEAAVRATTLLERVHIPAARERLHNYPHQLSGGMRQRVMIAMAIANKPSVIIADEPTTALDVTTQAQVLALIDEISREEGASIILISHNLNLVGDFCDRVAVMYAGRIVESGSTEQIFRQPRHPYTAGLIASMPPLDADVDSLIPIPGDPPDPRRSGHGCPFGPRCHLRQSICDMEVPPLSDPVDGQASACFFPDRVRLVDAGSKR